MPQRTQRDTVEISQTSPEFPSLRKRPLVGGTKGGVARPNLFDRGSSDESVPSKRQRQAVSAFASRAAAARRVGGRNQVPCCGWHGQASWLANSFDRVFGGGGTRPSAHGQRSPQRDQSPGRDLWPCHPDQPFLWRSAAKPVFVKAGEAISHPVVSRLAECGPTASGNHRIRPDRHPDF